jgi:glycosyltransferase involved in cell wall biosynthesis
MKMKTERTSANLKQTDAPRSGARVLFFDHTAAMGGGEIALLNLVRHLDPKKVTSIVVVGTDGALVDRLRPEIEVYVLPLPSRVGASKKDSLGIGSLFRIREVLGLLGYIWRLAGFIRSHKVDLVHTNSLKADVIGGLAGRLARRPVIWHVRDRIEDDYLPRTVVRIFRMMCRVVPSYVIANSAATLRTIRPNASGKEDDDGVERSGARMSVVHDGTLAAPPADEGGSRNDFFRIGLIGRISPWKGQHVFLQAAAEVAKRFPEARFVIIGAALFGEHGYEQEVRELPSRLGIESAVEFTGFRDDIHAAIADLDLVVHASTTGEPFGQVIIEGMAAGKPVVATNGGGVPEIVADGRTGILVPMGDAPAMADAICAMLSDPEQARAMGVRARERVESHFTIELTARRVESVYREVLGLRESGLIPNS